MRRKNIGIISSRALLQLCNTIQWSDEVCNMNVWRMKAGNVWDLKFVRNDYDGDDDDAICRWVRRVSNEWIPKKAKCKTYWAFTFNMRTNPRDKKEEKKVVLRPNTPSLMHTGRMWWFILLIRVKHIYSPLSPLNHSNDFKFFLYFVSFFSQFIGSVWVGVWSSLKVHVQMNK